MQKAPIFLLIKISLGRARHLCSEYVSKAIARGINELGALSRLQPNFNLCEAAMANLVFGIDVVS